MLTNTSGRQPILTLLGLLALIFSSSGCQPSLPSAPAPTQLPAATLAVPPTGLPPTSYPEIPYDLISQESLFAYLTDLTAIQPYSGWRNTASSGEAEALDYVAGQLAEFASLKAQGLELERQGFNVYLSTELWDSRLLLTVNHQEIEVPADGLRGARYDRQLAVYLDSDGVLNDSNLDPLTATGAPLLVREAADLYTLTTADLQGRILCLDFSLIDSYVNSEAFANGSQLMSLIDRGLAGVVIVTQYSNRAGESHGATIGDGSVFQYQVPEKRVPILYVRREDLYPAGIGTWEDLQQIEAARLILDADMFSPGKSGNLIAHLPGADSSRAVILGAHIDSPNGPGAFDDGSGAAALLEVARVLDVSRLQPPVDVYLAWFGGHEIGTYGSAYFASTHQELLDRTLAMVQMDGLGHPLDESTSRLTLNVTSYGRFGDEQLPLPDFLAAAVAPQDLALDRLVEYGLIADNSNFDAFNVPNVYLGYYNAGELEREGAGYIHYSNHWHDPYETVALAREVGDAFVGLTKVLLATALEPGRTQPDLRVAPAPNRRALFVASHTESVTVATTMLRELGMALAWEGFDVDLIPYGQALTLSDLDNVSLIVLPPTLDYPGQYNEQWREAELTLLDKFVAQGGFLVVTNSAYNYVMKRRLDERNEDARALNPLLKPMGITFLYGVSADEDIARAVPGQPLMAEAAYLSFYGDNAVPFRMTSGLELAQAGGNPVVGLVEYGQQGGQILVIGDLGILQCDSNGAKNLEFIQNLARYARSR